MEITYLGGANFKIKGKQAVVTTNPFRVAEFDITGPGDYEVAGVTVFGIAGKNTVYKIVIDQLHLCFLGSLEEKLSDGQMDQIGKVDILFVGSGGLPSVAQLEPTVVISMAPVEGVVPVPKLVISKDKLPETTTVVVLE